MSAAGHTLTITALGDQIVPNNAYSGPSATAAPYNQKTITRHYGFGATQGTGSVTDRRPDHCNVTGWSDATITVTVPTGVAGLRGAAAGAVRRFGRRNAASCVITAGNGKQSIDAVTVTIGGKAPTHVPASGSIQSCDRRGCAGRL